MAIEAEKLLVRVVAQGADQSARDIRDIGDAGSDANRGVSILDSALDRLTGTSVKLGGVLQGLQGRIDAVRDEFAQVRNSATGASGGVTGFTAAVVASFGPLSLLNSRLGETEDDLDEVRNSAMGAAGAMGAYEGATLSSAVATYTMHDALIAGAIPSLTVLLSTLGPLTGAVGSLAAGLLGLASGFGAVIGTGILAWGDKLASQNERQLKQVEAEIAELQNLRDETGSLTDAQQKRLDQLKEQQAELAGTTTVMGALTEQMKQLAAELKEVLVPFGQQFIPLIQQAVDELPNLVKRMLDAAGSMQPFVDELRRLGRKAMDVIPRVTGWIMDLGREAIPVWRDFTDWVGTAVPNALEFFRSVVSRTWDSLHSLTAALLDALATFTEFGVAATNVVAPMLETILGGFEDLLNWVLDLPGPIRDLTIAISALAPVLTVAAVGAAEVVRVVRGLSGTFTTANTAVARLTPTFATMAKTMGVVAGAAVALALAYDRNFARIRDATDRVVRVLKSELIKTFQVAKSTIGPILRDLGGLFDGFSQTAEQALARIAMAVADRLVGGIRTAGAAVRDWLRQLGALWTQHRETVLSTLKQLGTQIEAVLTTALSAFRTTAEVALNAVGVAWDELSSAIFSTLPSLIERLRNLRQSFVNLAQKIPLTEQAVGAAISILGVLAGSTIGTVIGAVVSLATAWETNFLNIRGVTQSAAQYLQSEFRSAVEMAMNAIQGAITFVTEMTNRLRQLVPTVRQTGQSFLSGLVPAIQNTIQRGQAFIDRYVNVDNAIKAVSVAAGVLATSILGLASPFNTVIGVAATLFGRFTKLLTPIRTLAELLATRLSGAFKAARAAVGVYITASQRIYGVLQTVIGAARSAALAFGTGGLSGVITALAGRFPNLTATIVRARAVLQTIIGVAAKVAGRLGMSGLAGVLTTLGQNITNLSGLLPTLGGRLGQLATKARMVAVAFGNKGLAGVTRILGQLLKSNLSAALGRLAPILTQTRTYAQMVAVALGNEGLAGAATVLSGILRSGLRTAFVALPAPIQQVIARANLLISRFGVVQGTLTAVRGVLPSLRAAFVALPAPIQQIIARANVLISRFGVMQGALVAVQGVLPSISKLFARLPTPMQQVIARANLLISRAGGLRGAIVALSGVIPKLTTLLSGLPTLLKRVATGSTTLRARMGAGGLHPAVIMLRDGIQKLRGVLVNLPAAMQRVAGRATTLITRLGQAGIRGAVVTLATSIPRLRDVLASIPGALKRVGVAAKRLIPRLLAGGLRGALLRLATFIPTLVGALGSIGPALLAITGPIGVVAAAAATLYAAWKTNFLGVRDLVNRVMSGIRTTLQGDMSAIRSTMEVATSAINNLWHNKILPLAETTRRAFNKIREVVGNAVTWIWKKAVQPALAGIEDLYRIHGEELLNEIVETYDAIRSYIEQFWSYIKPLIQGGTAAAIGFWQKWGDEILAIVEFTMDTVGNVIKIAVDAILTTIRVFLNAFQGDWDEALTAILNFWRRTLDEIASFAQEWGGRLLNYITGLLADLYQAFVDWANDLIFGSLITEMFNAILSAAETFGSDLLSSISSSLQDVYNEAQQQFQNILERAQSILNSLSSWVRSSWDIVSALRSTFRSAGSAAGSALKSAFNAAVPSSVSLPTAEVAGKTIGGGSMSLPQLDTGGFIEEDGMAMLHEGERVLPESQVTRGGLPEIPLEGVGGGTGSGDTNIDIEVTIEGDADKDDVEEGIDSSLSGAMDAYGL